MALVPSDAAAPVVACLSPTPFFRAYLRTHPLQFSEFECTICFLGTLSHKPKADKEGSSNSVLLAEVRTSLVKRPAGLIRFPGRRLESSAKQGSCVQSPDVTTLDQMHQIVAIKLYPQPEKFYHLFH